MRSKGFREVGRCLTRFGAALMGAWAVGSPLAAETIELAPGARYISAWFCPGEVRLQASAREGCSVFHAALADLDRVQVEPVISPTWLVSGNKTYGDYDKRSVGDVADAHAANRRAVAVINGGFLSVEGGRSPNLSRFEGRGERRDLGFHQGWWREVTRGMHWDPERRRFEGTTPEDGRDLEDRVFHRAELRVFEDASGRQRARVARAYEPDAVGGTRMVLGGAGVLLPQLDSLRAPALGLDPYPWQTRVARTGVGFADPASNRLLLLTVPGSPGLDATQFALLFGLLLDDAARQSVPMAALHALSLDGGGSSQMWIRRPGAARWDVPHASDRRVVTALAVYSRAEGRWYLVPDPASPDPRQPRLLIENLGERAVPPGARGPFASEDEAFAEQQRIYRARGW